MSLFLVRCGELEIEKHSNSSEPSSISSDRGIPKTRTKETEYFSCFIGYISNEYIKSVIVDYRVEWEGYDEYGTLIPNSQMLLKEYMPERAVEYPLNDSLFASCRYITVAVDYIYFPDLPIEEWDGKTVNVFISQTHNGNSNQWDTLFKGTETIGSKGGMAYITTHTLADYYPLTNGSFDGQLGFYYSIDITIPE